MVDDYDVGAMMAVPSVTRLVITEDNPLLRDNLNLLIGGEPAFEVVALFGSAEEALASLAGIEPDMMLADLGLPGMSGIDLIAKARQLLPDLEIMAYTICEDRDSVFNALKAGANGYVLKGSTPRELLEALAALRDGGAPMSPRIARAVIREFQQQEAEDELFLSAKERDVLLGIQDGLSYKEIAQRLFVSPHTVHSHIKKIYEKLQASSKKEAVAKARRKGII